MRTRDVLLMLLLAGGGSTASAQEDVPEVAQRKLGEANRHREGGRTEEAIARYQEVLASAPGLLEAYVGLGALYHESGQFEKASEVFAAGLARVPGDATLLFNLAATEARLERFDQALAHADSALKAGGGEDVALYSLRGSILRRLGKHEEAVDAFRKVASLDSKSARAHYNLGNVLYELGRKEEALASFAQAVKLDEDFQPAHYNLGAVLFDLSRFDEALKAYEVALAPVEKDFAKGREVAPSHARAYLNLGAIFLQRQSWDRALDAYGKAARLDPSLAAAHYNLGFILYRLGRNPEAYEAYERAVKLDPALPLSYLHLGLIDFAAGRMENAARWLEGGLDKLAGSDRKQALLAMGQAQRALGNAARAEESYRAALMEDPHEVGALVGLSRLLRERGELQEARPLLEQAGEIVLDGSGVALELAALARAEGDSARERAMYEEALRRDVRPEMWPVRVNLASALVRGGNMKEARAQMEILMKQADAIGAKSPAVVNQLRTAYALLAAQEGNTAAARRELSAVLSLDPAFAPALNAGAAIDAVEGDVDKASTSFRGILGRTGGSSIDSLVRANLGQALWMAGRYDEARDPLLAAAEEFPGNAVVRSALGEIALRKGDYAGALRELGAAVEACKGSRGSAGAKEPSTRLELVLGAAAPSDAACARARRALAIALVGAAGEKLAAAPGRREAHRLASEAIALGAEGAALAQALFLRGTVELLEGQDARARADLEKALASGLAENLKGTARNNLGVALYRMGSAAEAQRQFEQARAASPRAAASVLNLAIAYHDAREPEKALVLYDEYLTLGGRRVEDARKWAEGIRRVYR